MINTITSRLYKQRPDPETEIAKAIYLVRESRTELENLAPLYMDWSVEAAENGQDEYSDQLLEERAELDDFCGDMKDLELKITKSAVTAKSFKNLSKLAETIKASRRLYTSGVNFSQIGSSLAEFKRNLGIGATAVKDLRRELSMTSAPADLRLSGVKTPISSKLAALREERDLRLMKSPTVIEPKEVRATGDIDIDAMMKDENSRR